MLDAGSYQYILLSYSEEWETVLAPPWAAPTRPGGTVLEFKFVCLVPHLGRAPLDAENRVRGRANGGKQSHFQSFVRNPKDILNFRVPLTSKSKKKKF